MTKYNTLIEISWHYERFGGFDNKDGIFGNRIYVSILLAALISLHFYQHEL